MRNQVDSSAGHHRVAYSYSVAGERYSGEFWDYGLQEEAYLKRNDPFSIRYNPSRPSQSYYPDLRTRRNFLLICFAIGGVVAILVIAFDRLAKS